ncbi:uncharacterized protein [Aristolochia californica]|uniref:uncharacterized protein n=1 Tax=Aristolochia californica TaxID=171875 RepID=UPI0035DA58A6
MSLVQIGNEQVYVETNKQQQQQKSQQKQQRQSQTFWGLIYRNVTRQRLEGAAMVAVSTAALIAIGRRYRRGKDARQHFQRSFFMMPIRGGGSVLQRVLNAHYVRVDSSTFQKAKEEAEELLSKISSKEDTDFNKLERLVAKMEMSGKEAEAVKILRDARDRAWENGLIKEAYELEMLMVEMLIYQGDAKSAEACKCLQQDYISDARRPLYKAVIELMAGNIAAAKRNWDDFLDLRELCSRPTSEEEAQVLPAPFDEFVKFQNLIMTLKEDIEEVHKQTPEP